MFNKTGYFICLLLSGIGLQAQQLSPQTINSAGNSSSNSTIRLESSIGGLVVQDISTVIFMYTPDFLQPDAGTTNSLPVFNNIVLNSGAGIDNAGTSFTAGNAMIEFTVGETASLTFTNGSMITQGILHPFNSGGALPITGLEFYANRLNNTTVQLNWKTLQEINNKGFHVERKKENENNFSEIAFVNSNAANGNSSFPLQYSKNDNNNFTANTYYRLKQEDVDGRTLYSIVQIVKGEAGKQLIMQVWPVPAIGYFNVLVAGISKPDIVQVFDMNGRMVKAFAVHNQTLQKVSGLTTGTYIVRLGSDKTISQKVLIQ